MKDDFKLINNHRDSAYEFNIDGMIAKIDYVIKDGDVVYLTHTEVPEPLQGRSVGKQLVLKTLQDIEKNNMKVVPLCAFAASYMSKHPEWNRLLMDGLYLG